MLIHFTPRNFAEKCCLKLVILGADHLTFGGGWGGGYRWFGKKISCRLISRGKKPCKEIPRGKKFLHWKKYLSLFIILEKKSYTVVCQGRNSPEVWGKNSYPNQITHTPPPPHKSQMVSPWAFFFHFLQCLSYCPHIWFERSLPLTQIFTSTSKLFMTI